MLLPIQRCSVATDIVRRDACILAFFKVQPKGWMLLLDFNFRA